MRAALGQHGGLGGPLHLHFEGAGHLDALPHAAGGVGGNLQPLLKERNFLGKEGQAFADDGQFGGGRQFAEQRDHAQKVNGAAQVIAAVERKRGGGNGAQPGGIDHGSDIQAHLDRQILKLFLVGPQLLVGGLYQGSGHDGIPRPVSGHGELVGRHLHDALLNALLVCPGVTDEELLDPEALPAADVRRKLQFREAEDFYQGLVVGAGRVDARAHGVATGQLAGALPGTAPPGRELGPFAVGIAAQHTPNGGIGDEGDGRKGGVFDLEVEIPEGRFHKSPNEHRAMQPRLGRFYATSVPHSRNAGAQGTVATPTGKRVQIGAPNARAPQ